MIIRHPLRTAFVAGVLALYLAAPAARAQSSLSVSITPPLFQLTIGPGESWSSAIKVVNTNTSDVTYYAQAVDFEAQGESGTPALAPIVGGSVATTSDPYSLASWITLPQASVTVPAGSSAEMPFSVHVPQNAEPGGHYGAILIGTQPQNGSANGALVKVSSYVSSLLFVRIKGDVIESGRIREFTSEKELYQSPQADFTLRFENTGNTHVKPEGSITIYNMWGKERGKVDINQDTGNFGNVLPQSIRKFQFSWAGQSDSFDIGLYRAVVTLAFGDQGKQSVSAITYFWVVPVVPVAVGLGSLAVALILLTWFIRRYIRRALSLEKERLGIAAIAGEPPAQRREHLAQTLMEPIREGVIDLRALSRKGAPPAQASVPQSSLRAPYASPFERITLRILVRKYKLFLLFIAVVLASSALLWWYFDRVLIPERHFEIKNVQIQEESASQK